ncbi:RsfA family transcriptional regulator [Tuberibacillus calidus]|jgi:prespore-specific regulator|uniref:RsfA family transcriptional regulator n=1 Tax=Tuberibacillus calidus TaxID=340097 RepID=UPI0004024220|nr:RsfA family transcriptional regulator [Tuberibacillus calidus]
MSQTRQDAWSEDEDLLLAETVLRHIREGSTQLMAFEEVGKALSRTAAACGFRWNSLVRKKYEDAIALAKKERKERQNQKRQEKRKNRQAKLKSAVEKPAESEQPMREDRQSITIDDIILYLNDLKQSEARIRQLKAEIEALKSELEKDQKQLEVLASERDQALTNLAELQSEYQTMLSIMDKARKLADGS